MKRAINQDGQITKMPNGKYKCRIRVTRGGREITVCATRDTMAKARDAARDKLEKLGYSSFDKNLSKSEGNKTFKKSFETYFKKASAPWKPSTRKVRDDFNRKMIIEPLDGYCVKDLTPQAINDVINSWSENYCNDSIKKSYNFLMKYLQALDKKGFLDFKLKQIDDRPASIKDSRKKEQITEDLPLILSKDEFRSLAFSTDTGTINDDYHAKMFYLMAWTGMRGQELRALTIDDIDFDKHNIRINKAATEVKNEDYGKNDKPKVLTIPLPPKTKSSRRRIGMNDVAEGLVEQLINMRPNKDSNLICQNSHGEMISKRSFAKFFDSTLKRAGIEKKGRGAHCLRHTFISYAFDLRESTDFHAKFYTPMVGHSPLFISKYVGHSDLSVTLRIYAHISGEELEDVEFNTLKLDEQDEL